MAKYAPLNRTTHERLSMGPTLSYGFARTTTLVPIILDEIAVVAREYPIIFPDNETGLPCALTGMRPETNAYVDDKEHWRADYIPIQLRQHPFAMTEVPGAQQDGKTRYTLCIDTGAREFSDLEGAWVFEADGTLTPTAKEKADLAQKLIKRSGITKAMVKLLDETGLLAERSIRMKLKDEVEPRQVQGFRVVDEKKLNELADEEFVVLRNKGVLPLVYAQLMSMANLKQGVLAGQVKPKAPAQDEKKKKDEGGIDLDMFIDDSGDFEIFH